jgi:hypothetical protein
MTYPTRNTVRRNRLFAACAIIFLTACGDTSNPIQVVDVDVRGTYDLTALKFDPQGVLGEVDLKSRITGSIPRLVLAANGQAQLAFVDPETGLITLSNATYTVSNGGNSIRLDFGTANTLYTKTFLSRTMTFAYSSTTHSLTFSASSPDGVSRARLVQLVPEWGNEQLLDPVPGTLTITFVQSTTAS